MTLAEVADAVGGVLDGATGAERVSTVTIDSRAVEAGALFVALAGERDDGHHHAAAALAGGATGVLAARPVGAPAVVVPDVTTALGALAAALLRRLPELTVVGVTGSSGKTTTKDLIAAVLEPSGPTVAPVGSWNNELGHPLTVLRADETTRHLVLEYSARGIGHIAYLAGIARPDIAVELNVGVAHLGEFGSQDAIAVAKGELVEALPERGLAVLNADDPRVLAMAGRASQARVVTYGVDASADLRAVDVRLHAGRPRFSLLINGSRADVALQSYGAHMVPNALAAAAVALELGVDIGEVAARLSAARPRSRWRMEVAERPDGVTVINDAYNANPESVRAALAGLAAIAGERRSWAVLGAMAELGDATDEAHLAAGREAVASGATRVVAVGAPMVAEGARSAGSADAVAVADVDEAVALLRRELLPGDVVLVKASRSAGLDRVAGALLTDQPAGAAR